MPFNVSQNSLMISRGGAGCDTCDTLFPIVRTLLYILVGAVYIIHSTLERWGNEVSHVSQMGISL